MKTGHVLLTVAIIAIAGAIGYEFLKKKGCGCKKGSGCHCGGMTSSEKKANASSLKVSTAVSADRNTLSTNVPSTNLTGMDQFFSPVVGGNWNNCDGTTDPIVDTVKHMVPVNS